jgi:hypothetical protein
MKLITGFLICILIFPLFAMQKKDNQDPCTQWTKITHSIALRTKINNEDAQNFAIQALGAQCFKHHGVIIAEQKNVFSKAGAILNCPPRYVMVKTEAGSFLELANAEYCYYHFKNLNE